MTDAGRKHRRAGRSAHAKVHLRLSILAAAGLLPIACGGAVAGDRDQPGPEEAAGTRGSGKPGSGGPLPGASGGRSNVGAGGNAPVPVIGGEGGRALPSCTAPEVEPVSGLVRCQEGYTHRPVAVACSIPGEASGDPAEPSGTGGAGKDSAGRPRANGTVPCEDDTAVCEAFELGYCDPSGSGGAVAVCRSGCRNDAECGPGQMCLCGVEGVPGGVCVQSECTSNADCQPGYLCASYQGGCGVHGFACQSPEDRCFSDADCPELQYCYPDLGPRTCDPGYECGRPFLIGGDARVALPIATSAWCHDMEWTPQIDDLAAAEREALAAHWTRMGQLEHASIAAFARFQLQLLSLGAPPELIDGCTSALADETAHAKLCFGLASAYAGHAVGPGPLDVSDSLAVTTLTDIVDLVIVEGCVGETSAALEALEAARTARDPVIQAAYTRIADDEQRHAALAFRFVRWALERAPGAVTQRILAARRSAPLRHSSVRDVVLPCLNALLSDERLDSIQELHT